MAGVTLRVLDGADRGKTYEEVSLPVTLGREDGNGIQINDERVSRYHVKLQQDKERIVLTDLDSTNGTKVNGETIRLWILRPGDVIMIGRTMLVYGSEQEIAYRLAELRGADLTQGVPLDVDDMDDPESEHLPSFMLESELNWSEDPDAQMTLHTLLPPELPDDFNPGQAAQVSELLHYLHLRLRNLARTAEVSRKSNSVTIPQRRWQDLLDLELRLAEYLKQVGEPE
ncbi:MAG: FHA domain-containing protein [Planctomycetia bacterium]|jgi:hypothetical protein